MLVVTVAVNEHDVAWLEARRQNSHDRPLPAGTYAYRWAQYERRQGELRCTGSGTLFHDVADGAVELASKLMRAATRRSASIPAPQMRPDAAP